MAHKKRTKNVMYVFLQCCCGPRKKKMAHKKKELNNVCFCSVVSAREGKNCPQKKELMYVFAALWWPEKEIMAHNKKELKNV